MPKKSICTQLHHHLVEVKSMETLKEYGDGGKKSFLGKHNYFCSFAENAKAFQVNAKAFTYNIKYKKQ